MSSTELSMTDLAVCAALERLAEEHQMWAEKAETNDERTFFRRWANSFRKATCYWLQGVRPEQAPSTCWYVSSATRGGVVHHVDKMGHCTCEAGVKNVACWHAALVAGIEVAADDIDRFDGGDTEVVCSEPDNLCSVDRPCPTHAAAAADYLAPCWSDGTPVPLEMPDWLQFETRIAA